MISDWTQLTSKSHKEIFIGDLVSYTKSQISSNSYSEDKSDYKITCPYCIDAYKSDKSYSGPYTKYKLYVTKDFQLGHCFRCGKVFIEQGNDDITLDFSVPELPITMKDFQLTKLNGKLWNLDLWDQFDDYDELGYNYLIQKRHHYFKQLYKALGIKFSNHNPVIPFYYRGELIYYQIKMAFGKSKLPYFSPPIPHKPAYVIEHGDNKQFVISEGTFDGIADLILYPDRTPFCLLGSDITDYQIAMLRTYVPDDILVYMDDTKLSLKVADKISQYINYANIHIRKSGGQDPEEYLKYRISQSTELL